MEEKRIILKSEDGTSNEYTLLLLFKSNKKNKEYILYTDETYDYDDNLNIFDRQIISCTQSILRFFNIKNNYKDYIKNLKICDIIELIKSYRMNYYEDANCKYIDKYYEQILERITEKFEENGEEYYFLKK